MSKTIKYGFDISGVQRMLDSMSPVIQAAQMSNAVVAAMPTSIINQQLLDATQPMREAAERLHLILNSDGIARVMENSNRISEIIGSSIMFEANSAVQSLLRTTSLQVNIKNSLEGLKLGIDPAILRTMQGLTINISGVEEAIQNNLKVFRGIDWSAVIDPDDLEDLDIQNALDGAVIDINDGISFQQQVAEFINKLKSKSPVVFLIFYMFVISPIQSAIDEAVLGVIRGTTTPIIEQAQTTDYRVIEKNIRIEVNNTLNINIDSKDVRDDLLEIYGYVSTGQLIIRQTNKVKSKALHTVEFGQVVRIVHKDRNWTLVEYESDEVTIQGWVFTRYISKFKK